MKRILIHNDNGRRDLLGLKLLERALVRRGFKVYMSGRTSLKSTLRRVRPHALIAARGDNAVAVGAATVCRVYVVPGEGGRTTKETTLSVFLGRGYTALKSADWIRRCYLWNRNTETWLLETGMLRPSQMKIVGNPRLDIYRCPGFKEIISRKPGAAALRIGIAFSATSTSGYYGHPHFATVYHDSIRNDYVFPIVAPGRHMEDIVWRDHAILRNMMHVIREVGERSDATMLLRPNPLEGIGEYRFLEKRYPGRFKVMYKEPLPEFLAGIDVLLTCWSTAGIEAILNGIPVISINGLMNEGRLFDHIAKGPSGFTSFVPHYHSPSNSDELLALLRLAGEGKLPPSSQPPGDTAEMIEGIYGWAAGQPGTCELIAEDIAADMQSDDHPTGDGAAWSRALPLKYGVPPRIAELAVYLRDVFLAARSGEFRSYMSFLSSRDPYVSRLLRRVC